RGCGCAFRPTDRVVGGDGPLRAGPETTRRFLVGNVPLPQHLCRAPGGARGQGEEGGRAIDPAALPESEVSLGRGTVLAPCSCVPGPGAVFRPAACPHPGPGVGTGGVRTARDEEGTSV